MTDVLFQMSGLIVCGVLWRFIRPAGLDPVATRKVLTSLVYYLLLPALVLSVLWRAELGASSLSIASAAAVGIFAGLLLSYFSCHFCKIGRAEAGALMLAATFPNATYLGLPVLEATFGTLGKSVAIQYDLFACTPLLFTLGIWLASHWGEPEQNGSNPHREFLHIPAVWAAVLAIGLNVLQVPMPDLAQSFLSQLDRGVVPLMLFSLGLSLEWHKSRWQLIPALLPVCVITLFAVPALVLLYTNFIGMEGDLKAAVILEAAMPSMVLGLVLCDRFNLDTSLYAATVTVTTALSLISLPLWFQWIA